MFHISESSAGDVAVCADFSSHVVAKFFQKVLDQQGVDEALQASIRLCDDATRNANTGK